jgi:hypothetical protein
MRGHGMGGGVTGGLATVVGGPAAASHLSLVGRHAHVVRSPVVIAIYGGCWPKDA